MTQAIPRQEAGQNEAAAVWVRPARSEEALAIHAVTQAAYAEYREQSAPSAALLELGREVQERMARGEFRAAIAFAPDVLPGVKPALAGAVRFKVDQRGLYFFRLAVAPEFRGRGVARVLLDFLEQEAVRSHVHKLWCQVRLIVPRNVALYESRGFRIVARHTVVRNGVEVPTATMEKRTGPNKSADIEEPAATEGAD